ncbi:hypothetical protein [Mycobacteroides abscessus]|uniref:hypothetical protein n=1 Tax=Mycobacteroides abscessus TaxID=36809 RepID=UPI0009271C6F|nr:hypothetical protein [Mycobacteroides abscessus]MDO3245242.1 hypothetical protein [Mycobacteroides abscessus subsp. abscessus]MDO3327505.1 hypothetical protein [Mycobacteroides abscessus subsp. abscessus]MDO3347275.1 hypothetical protein [Mycobacteroides abscessus subsp. abscessus]SHT36736.1 Uncharacterised protein [Mycobacteroides abscessus subsp. abscessus]SHU45764.1 Uncharacterised protein [Mycobacteroides abscessus subsp. abscessus]
MNTAHIEKSSGRWEVRLDPASRRCAFAVYGAGRVTYVGGPRRWNVKSPRGVQVFTTHDPVAAMELARAMANIDELLARVNRIEHGLWGNHPALRAQMTNKRNGAKTASRGTLTLLQDPHA